MPLRNEVSLLMGSIWSAVLGWDVEPLFEAEAPLPANALIGSVRISGSWGAEVRLICPVELARAAAGAMFGLSAGAVTDADTADALGELTNMLGGNFKALLPGVNALGLPAVVAGPGAPPCGRLLVRAGFVCRGWPLAVSVVVEREPAVSAALVEERSGEVR